MALTATAGKHPRGAMRAPRKLKDLSTALFFLLPAIIVLGTFNFYPALYSLYLSFFEWNGTAPSKTAVGLGNYTRLLSSVEFWNSLKVTLI